jgi:hypothetical protein
MADLREQTPDTTVFGIEEATAKMLTTFEAPFGDKLKTLSDITPHEVFGLNLINQYGKIFHSKITEGWIKDHLLLRISMFRMGRKEDILIATGLREGVETKKGKGKLTDLFAGFR